MPITSTTTTNLSSTVPQIYSHMTADYREANLILTNMFDRRYEAERTDHADRVLIHGVDRFQDETSTQANSLGVAGSLTFDTARLYARISLIADTHIYQAFDLEYEADLFSNIGLMDKLTKASGYATAHRIDDDAAAFIDDMDNTVGTLAVGLSDANIRRAVQYLSDAFAPSGNRFFVFSPAEQMNLMSIEKFVNLAYKGSIGNVEKKDVYTGYQAHIYGCDWYMSQNVEGTNSAGHDNGIFHRECVAALVVESARPVTHYEIGTDSTRYATHAIYGFVEVRGDHGVWARGL